MWDFSLFFKKFVWLARQQGFCLCFNIWYEKNISTLRTFGENSVFFIVPTREFYTNTINLSEIKWDDGKINNKFSSWWKRENYIENIFFGYRLNLFPSKFLAQIRMKRVLLSLFLVKENNIQYLVNMNESEWDEIVFFLLFFLEYNFPFYKTEVI